MNFSPEMLRPGTKEALIHIREIYPTAEFFVYSYGMDKYVHDTISIIENEWGDFRFNRPIFSRSNSIIDGNKSILVNIPTVIKSLQSKYPKLQSGDIIDNHVLFIDNRNSDVIQDLPEKHIKCPDYLHNPMVDIRNHVPIEILRDPIVTAFLKTNYYPYYVYNEDTTASIQENDLKYHVFMSQLYSKYLEINETATKDDFFPRLVKELKKYKKLIKPFSNKNIEKINKSLT